jgi:hypothetical protein
VCGGYQSTITGPYGFIGGGHTNAIDSNYAVVAGGRNNSAIDHYTVVGGGAYNTASGEYAVVPGGLSTVASGDYSFAFGHQTTASGLYGFAIGYRAVASTAGSFVWADNSSTSYFGSQRNYQFRARAAGGARFDVNNSGWFEIYDDGTDLVTTSTGAHLTLGGTWVDVSDRNKKENFTAVDRGVLLEKIASLPIMRWNYKAESDDVTHIGPCSQDFHAAFGVGNDDKSIAALDGAGIALLAIQELYEKTREIDQLKEQLSQLREAKEKELSELRQQLGELTVLVETTLAQNKKASKAGSDNLAIR